VKLLREILIIDSETYNFYQNQPVKVQKKIDFIKKTNKTPQSIIQLAENRKKQFQNKKQ
jgi:hypothetical protein